MAFSSGVVPRPGAGVGADAEQQAHILHPVGDGGRGKQEVQAGGLADQHIDRGARHTELVIEQTIVLLNWFRRLRIRWEIRDDTHQAFMTLAVAIICWRQLTR